MQNYIPTYKPYANFDRTCPMCKKDFSTNYQRQNICSFSCRQEASRERSLAISRMKRQQAISGYPPCEVCGFNNTIDQHHEADGIHYLCPNHHALITRGITTLEKLKHLD